MPAGAPAYPLSAYLAAVKAAAAAETRGWCVDLGARMPAMSTGAAGMGMYFDGGHFSDKGNGVVADVLAALLAA